MDSRDLDLETTEILGEYRSLISGEFQSPFNKIHLPRVWGRRSAFWLCSEIGRGRSRKWTVHIRYLTNMLSAARYINCISLFYIVSQWVPAPGNILEIMVSRCKKVFAQYDHGARVAHNGCRRLPKYFPPRGF